MSISDNRSRKLPSSCRVRLRFHFLPCDNTLGSRLILLFLPRDPIQDPADAVKSGTSTVSNSSLNCTLGIKYEEKEALGHRLKSRRLPLDQIGDPVHAGKVPVIGWFV